jgi:hypothetical protein
VNQRSVKKMINSMLNMNGAAQKLLSLTWRREHRSLTCKGFHRYRHSGVPGSSSDNGRFPTTSSP